MLGMRWNLVIDDRQKFTSESRYERNGEDFTARKNDIGVNWINPAKRKRKWQIYSIDKYYKQALNTGGRTDDAKPITPHAPKQVPHSRGAMYDNRGPPSRWRRSPS